MGRRRRKILIGGGALLDPTTISGLKLWLDASDDSTITTTGNLVDTWADKSGNSNDAAGSGGTRPDSGTDTINSKNVITFDSGSSEVLTVTDSTDFDHAGGGFTLFVVGSLDSPGATQNNFISKYRNNLGEEWILGHVTTGSLEVFGSYSTDGSTTTSIGTGTSVSADTAFACGLYYSEAEHFSVLHAGTEPGANVSDITTTSGSQNIVIGGVVAGGSFLAGKVAEILYWNRELTYAEINQVGAYLNSKWGVAWTSATSMQETISSACFDCDAAYTPSYPGSGNEIFNMVLDPADGQTQAHYDFFRGIDSGGTNGPTFNVDTFDADGDQQIAQQNDAAGFPVAIHRNSSSQDFWLAFSVYVPDPFVSGDTLFQIGASTTSGIKLEMQTVSSSSTIRARFRGSSTEFLDLGDVNVGGWNFIVMSGNTSEYTWKIAVNSKVWSPPVNTDADSYHVSGDADVTGNPMYLMANTEGSGDIASGYSVRSWHGGNGNLTQAELASLVDFIEARHGVTYTATATAPGLQAIESSTCFHIEMTSSDCYPGTGTTLSNLVAVPADGASQTDYDFELFDADGSGLPTFSGTVGTIDARLDLDVDRAIRVKDISAATMLNEMHQSDKTNGYWIAVVLGGIKAHSFTSAQEFLWGTSDSSDRGMTCFLGTSGNPHVQQASDSFTSTEILDSANPGHLHSNVPVVLLVTWDAATNECKGYFSNNDLDTGQTLTFNTITGSISADSAGNTFMVGAYPAAGVAQFAPASADREQAMEFFSVAGGNAYLNQASAKAVVDHIQAIQTRRFMNWPI